MSNILESDTIRGLLARQNLVNSFKSSDNLSRLQRSPIFTADIPPLYNDPNLTVLGTTMDTGSPVILNLATSLNPIYMVGNRLTEPLTRIVQQAIYSHDDNFYTFVATSNPTPWYQAGLNLVTLQMFPPSGQHSAFDTLKYLSDALTQRTDQFRGIVVIDNLHTLANFPGKDILYALANYGPKNGITPIIGIPDDRGFAYPSYGFPEVTYSMISHSTAHMELLQYDGNRVVTNQRTNQSFIC